MTRRSHRIVGEPAVRHFGHLSRAQTDALFETPPEPFDRDSGPELLSVALGATLYMPADRPALAADLDQAGRRPG